MEDTAEKSRRYGRGRSAFYNLPWMLLWLFRAFASSQLWWWAYSSVASPVCHRALPSSFQFRKSFTANSHTPKRPQQPPTVSHPLLIADSGPLLLFPDPGQSLPEQQPQTKRFVQRAAVPSQPGCRSPQPYAPNFSGLIDQFPFVFFRSRKICQTSLEKQRMIILWNTIYATIEKTSLKFYIRRKKF